MQQAPPVAASDAPPAQATADASSSQQHTSASTAPRARPLLVGLGMLYRRRVRLLSFPDADAVDGRGDEDQYYEREDGDVADAAEADAAYTQVADGLHVAPQPNTPQRTRTDAPAANLGWSSLYADAMRIATAAAGQPWLFRLLKIDDVAC